jgi:hypothetical protein
LGLFFSCFFGRHNIHNATHNTYYSFIKITVVRQSSSPALARHWHVPVPSKSIPIQACTNAQVRYSCMTNGFECYMCVCSSA